MTLQKILGWNKLLAAVVFSALFLLSGLIMFTPTAYAAPSYTWEKPNYIKVGNFDHPDNSQNRPNFYFTCSGTFPTYTCVAPRNINQDDPDSPTYTTDPHLQHAGHCPPELRFSGDSSKAAMQLYTSKLVNGRYECTSVNPTIPITVGNTGDAPADLPDKSPGAAGKETPPDPELECGTPWSDILWQFCPIVYQLRNFAGSLDSIIYSLLTVDQEKIFDVSTDTGKGFHEAWQTLAYLAVGLLVISSLIMIIAHALGFEILDAYTIKKVLPRLVIAIVGMTLSWELMKWLVIFTNDLGLGIRQLMYWPFRDVPAQFAPGASTSIIAIILGLAGFAALGIGGLVSLVITAVASLLIAFLVLVLRQVIIVILIVFAPIAIAASVLPNTRSLWNFWWTVFSRLLLMFPIIIAIITMGRIFAVTALGTNAGSVGGTLFIPQFIAYAALIVSYFMILWAFQFAGKLGAALAGIANDRSRGLFDRLKKGRGQRIAENTARMKAGTRFNNRPLNAMTARGTTWMGGFGRRGRAALEQKNTLAAMDYAKSPKGQSIQHNDRALQAMTYGSAMEARANMARDFNIRGPGAAREVEESIAQAKSAGGFGRANQVYAAQQLAATGTGYENLEQTAQTIRRAAHDNPNAIHAMSGYINSTTKQQGRHDLAPGFANLDRLAMQEAGLTRGLPNYGAAREQAWGSASLYQHGNDKARNIDNAIAHYTPMLNSPVEQERERAGVFFNELGTMQPNATGEVRDRIQTALDTNRTAIANLYDDTHPNFLGASNPGVADRRVNQQPYLEFDAATGNYVNRSTAGNVVPENPVQRVDRQSRTYERPDPNRL